MTVITTYPTAASLSVTIRNNAAKYAYIYAMQEALRLRHNQESAKIGVTITREQFDSWVLTWYEPRSRTVIRDLLELRNTCKTTSFTINVDTIPLS